MLHIFIEAEFMNQNSTLWFYKFHTCMWNLTKKKVEGSTDYLEEVEGQI